MSEVSPAWFVSAVTTVGAIIAGFWTYKSSRAQAQPNAQEAINAGFTSLTAAQDRELTDIRRRLSSIERRAETAEAKAVEAAEAARHAERRASRLEAYTQKTSGWHERHIPFDQRAKEVIELVAPEEVPNLPAIEPFPVWRDEEDPE